jgi:hypothetical protein
MDINRMFNYNTTRLEKSCNQLISDFGKRLTWKWDDRFETVLAEFSVTDKQIIYPLITRHMGEIWALDQGACPPKVVQMIIDYFGGLTPGQTLFTSDPNQDGLLLCAWWPWGNGKTISIRLGVFADSLSDPDNEELTQRFRSWFDI